MLQPIAFPAFALIEALALFGLVAPFFLTSPDLADERTSEDTSDSW